MSIKGKPYKGQLLNGMEVMSPLLDIVYELFSFLLKLMHFRFFAPWIELVRCCSYVGLEYMFLSHSRIYTLAPVLQRGLLYALRSVFVTSFIFWLQFCLRRVTITMYTSKVEKEA